MMIPPEITAETRAFWEAAAQDRFVTDYCVVCDRWIFPPRGRCGRCDRPCEVRQVAPDAVVYSLTVNRQSWGPEVVVPFGLALAEFPAAPGVRLLGRVGEEHLDAITIGSRVQLVFLTDGPYPVARFIPAEGTR